MADLSKTVGIIFKASDQGAVAAVSKLEDALKSMQASVASGGGINQLSADLRNATEPMANLAVGALKLEAGLLTAGAAMTVFAAKTAGDFDTAFRQITTLFDASAEDVAKFRDNILAFASGSSKPVADITEALQAAIGAGVDYTKSLDLIATAEKLAVATRADLKGTTEVLVSTLNAYGLQTDDAGRVADLFFQTIKDGKIEMDDLARSFAMVTPLAAASGVSLEEIGAAVATLTASGVPAGQAIEYLRSLLTNIVKPSQDASEMAEQLGIKFDSAALKSKGLSGVLLDVGKAVDGNTGQMSKLVGDVGGLVAALALTGPQAAAFAESLRNMGDSTGAVSAAFEKMSGSIDVASAKVANAFRGMLINIGTPLLDEFGGIANAIAKVFNALGEGAKSGALNELVRYIETVLGSLQGTIEKVAQNLPAALAKADLSGFTRGIDAVAAGFSRLFAGIDLSTVDGLTRAVEFAGAAFLGLSKFTAGVIESFKPLFDFLVKVADGATQLDSSVFKMAGNMAGVASQMNLLAGGINDMLPALEALLNLVLIKQGIGLLGAFKGLAGVLPGLPTMLLALGAAAGSERIVALVDATMQWKQALDHLAESQRTTTALQEAAIPTLERFAQSTGLAVKSIDEANDLISSGAVVWDDAANGWVRAGEAIASAADGAGSATEDQGRKTLQSAEAMMVAADKAETLARWGGKLKTSGTDAAAGIDRVGDSSAKAAKESQKAAEAAQKMALELEKIASNERIKVMEFKAKIDVARIEADAEKVKAAFNSINVGIESTGDVLGNLFGMFDKLGSLDSTAYRAIFDQIAKENGLREQSFNLQKQLTEAQIENMRAQTDRMRSGDALIKIDGAGLKPHLEAFMWEILRTIQMRVNRDGLQMLLGVNP